MASRQSARLVSQLEVPKGPPPAGLPEYPQTRSRKKQRLSVLGADQCDHSYLTKLSPDILLEIFHQLEPIDVLHLSRASKKLRHLTASGNFTSVWKAVRVSIASGMNQAADPGASRLTTTFLQQIDHHRVLTTSTFSIIPIFSLGVTVRYLF